MIQPAELRDVSKRFGDIDALADVSYEVSSGEILALLGPNGAGKSTSISLLLGLRRPDTGSALLFGRDPSETASRARIGTTPQEMSFPGTLRVRELLDLVRAHYTAPADADELLARFGLGELAGRQAGALSGGERRRLAVALAFAGDPELVILDEPTTGLDADTRQEVWRTLKTFVAEGGSVLLTTHYLEEAEALADAIVVIDGGRIVGRGSVGEIRGHAGGGRISFRREPLPPELAELGREVGGRILIESPEPEAIVRRLVLSGAALADLDVRPLPLEEAIRSLPGGNG